MVERRCAEHSREQHVKPAFGHDVGSCHEGEGAGKDTQDTQRLQRRGRSDKDDRDEEAYHQVQIIGLLAHGDTSRIG